MAPAEAQTIVDSAALVRYRRVQAKRSGPSSSQSVRVSSSSPVTIETGQSLTQVWAAWSAGLPAGVLPGAEASGVA